MRWQGRPGTRANYDELEDDDDDADDGGDDDDDEDVEDHVCYKCITSGDDGEFSGVIDRIEQDVYAAFSFVPDAISMTKKFATTWPSMHRTNSLLSSHEKQH